MSCCGIAFARIDAYLKCVSEHQDR